MSLLERLASRTSEAEVYEARSDTIEVTFTNGQVKGALARESSGVAVRAIRDGKLGFAASSDRTERAQGKLVENLLDAIAVGDPAGFTFPGKLAPACDPARLALWDERCAQLGPRDLVAIGEKALAAVKEKHPHVAFDLQVRRSLAEVRLENSRGARCEEKGTTFSFSLDFNRTRESDVFLDGDGCWGVGQGEEVERVVARVLEKLERGERDAKLSRTGLLPVYFSAGGSTLVWSPLFEGLSGKAVQTGTSPIRDKRGERVLDSRIEISDDGTLPGLAGSSPWDDEGTPRRARKLIEGGVVRGFVHDLRTAASTKQEPTGNASRPGILGAPGPSFSNVLVRPGTRSQRDLLRSIDYGLLVESVLGQGQGNTISGSFSNTVNTAYLVEKGEVVGRVKDVSIAGNVYEVLRDRLGDLGSELDTSSGNSRLPAVLVSGLSVVAKT